jgi:hypothetical protein
METIIKTKKISKDTFKAIEEVKLSKDKKGKTSNGFRFIKTLTQIILL